MECVLHRGGVRVPVRVVVQGVQVTPPRFKPLRLGGNVHQALLWLSARLDGVGDWIWPRDAEPRLNLAVYKRAMRSLEARGWAVRRWGGMISLTAEGWFQAIRSRGK